MHIIPSFASAFGIFRLRQFPLNIQRELEDTARIDGASIFITYWRIMLPLAKPTMITLGSSFFTGLTMISFPIIILIIIAQEYIIGGISRSGLKG